MYHIGYTPYCTRHQVDLSAKRSPCIIFDMIHCQYGVWPNRQIVNLIKTTRVHSGQRSITGKWAWMDKLHWIRSTSAAHRVNILHYHLAKMNGYRRFSNNLCYWVISECFIWKNMLWVTEIPNVISLDFQLTFGHWWPISWDMAIGLYDVLFHLKNLATLNWSNHIPKYTMNLIFLETSPLPCSI